MKKKISLLLCFILTFAFCLTGCAVEQAPVEYDEAEIEEQIEFLINYCQNADEATLKQWNAQDDFSQRYQFMMSGIKMTPESFDSAVESWKAGVEECGVYISHGDYIFQAKKDELDVTLPVQYEDRSADILFVFDEKSYLQSMDISAHYELSEILEKAGMNTLLGMGTVFAVLIFISILISFFKIIPKIQESSRIKKEKKRQKRKGAKEPDAVVEDTKQEDVIAEEAEEEIDDLELIAVIAAAIAAAEGTTTDGFVVRSIRRRPSNKWNVKG